MIKIITATIKTKNLVNVFCKIPKMLNTIIMLLATDKLVISIGNLKLLIKVTIDRSINMDHSVLPHAHG